MTERVNPEGYGPSWRDRVNALLADMEVEYDRLDFEQVPTDIPQEVLRQVEKLMNEHGFKEEVEAKRRAIQWWSDYKERRLGR